MTGIVLGGSGMLGQAFVGTLVRAGVTVLAPGHQELDLTNEIAVRKYIAKHRPNYIINCAAMTDVDACEKEPGLARAINGDSVAFVASAAKKFKSKLVHISTDYVFDGFSTVPYNEDDAPHPIQAYGESKLIGEQHALKAGGVVFRVQWLFGQARNNFIDWVARSIAKGDQIPITREQVGCPSSTLFVANLVALAMATAKTGIYHVAHDEPASRWEVAKYIAEYFRVETTEYLLPIKGKFGISERPQYTALNTDKIKKLVGMRTLGTWQADVLAYIASRYTPWNR